MSHLVEVNTKLPPVGSRPASQNYIQPAFPMVPASAAISTASVAQAPQIAQPTAIPNARNSFKEHVTTVNITENVRMKDLAQQIITVKMNKDAATKVFKPTGAQAQAQVPDLSRALITSVSVESIRNELPVDLKVDCTGIGDNCTSYDMAGKPCPIVLHANENWKGSHNVFNATGITNDYVMTQYGHLGAKDISDGIMTLDKDWSLVRGDHETLNLMRKNPGLYVPPEEMNGLRGWYKVNTATVNEVKGKLQEVVMNKIKYEDLTNFCVSISRMDERKFDDCTGSTLEHLDETDRKVAMETPHKVAFALKIHWTYPTPTAPASVHGLVPQQNGAYYPTAM